MGAIREVGPIKHFLGCAHTHADVETAFYGSPIADDSNEPWAAEGSQVVWSSNSPAIAPK